MAISGVPIVNLPELYMNGLQISNDATTPNTLLDIATGACRDSTNTVDMVANSAIVINAATNGFNGLDTGSLAASKIYRVFLISDPVNNNPTGGLLSLAVTPLMPFGYSAYRVIGHVATDGSSHFLKGYWQGGNSTFRKFIYDAPQATAVTAGAATSYTAVDLSALVPGGTTAVAASQVPVMINFSYTPNAAGHTFKMQGVNSTGDTVTITGQVTSVVVSDNVEVWAQTTSSKPEINYKVSNGSDAVAINVAGYTQSL